MVLDKLNLIEDRFEQSFSAMVHLPYLQPFSDINKRPPGAWSPTCACFALTCAADVSGCARGGLQSRDLGHV